MARKKKNETSDFLLIVLVFSLFAAPFVAIIVCFLSKKDNLKYEKYLNNGKIIFKHSHEELKRMLVLCKEISNAKSMISDARNAGQKVKLSINKDGSFSKRSQAGKEIDKIIRQNNFIITESSAELSRIKERPDLEWGDYNENLRYYFAAKFGIQVWLFSFICFYVYQLIFSDKSFVIAYSLASVSLIILSLAKYFINHSPGIEFKP